MWFLSEAFSCKCSIIRQHDQDSLVRDKVINIRVLQRVFMKFFCLSIVLLGLVSFIQEKNPDIRLTVRPWTYSDAIMIQNASKDKIYTATIRRRQFRKRYKVYKSDGIFDTVAIKRDTLVKISEVVIGPRRWQFLTEDFSGSSAPMIIGKVAVDTGSTNIFKIKLLNLKQGGDVRKTKPQPFEENQLSGGIKKAVSLYQGDL